MEITKVLNGADCTFELEGRLDTTTAPELENAVNSVTNDVNTITFDFLKIEYISSAGLRVLLATHKLMLSKGGLTIINANDTVKGVLEMTGLDSVLNIK